MEVANAILSSTILLVAFGLAFWLALSKARSKIVAPETDKSIPLIRPMSNYTARVNDCLGRDILSARQMALRAAALYPSTPLREQRGPVMPVTEETPRQLMLKSGSTTLTLDKTAGKATLQRKLLIWRLKPIEAPLSDISDVTVDTAVDRASGVEVCHTMLVRRTGEAWALPAADKKDAEINASAIRDFLAGPDLAPPSVGTLSAPTLE